MTTIKTIARTLAIAAALAAPTGSLYAADTLTMKPRHGISFDVGSDRAVSYFVAKEGSCKLVVTIAGEPDWDNPQSFAPTRFEALVSAERTVRYNATEGKTLAFFCAAGATAMSVTGLEKIAANAH